MESKSPERRFYYPAPKAWHPGLFAGVVLLALFFWPLAVLGLWSLISGVEARRNQGIAVIIASIVGLLWGSRVLWGLFGA